MSDHVLTCKPKTWTSLWRNTNRRIPHGKEYLTVSSDSNPQEAVKLAIKHVWKISAWTLAVGLRYRARSRAGTMLTGAACWQFVSTITFSLYHMWLFDLLIRILGDLVLTREKVTLWNCLPSFFFLFILVVSFCMFVSVVTSLYSPSPFFVLSLCLSITRSHSLSRSHTHTPSFSNTHTHIREHIRIHIDTHLIHTREHTLTHTRAHAFVSTYYRKCFLSFSSFFYIFSVRFFKFFYFILFFINRFP